MTPRVQQITREAVLEAALAMVDEGGIGSVTMRKLAGRLGIEAMSLYHHFPDKDAILDGVVERVFSGMTVPEPLPEGWMALTEEMFVAFRRALLEHPNTIGLLARRPLNTGTSADFVEMPLVVLSRSGLPPQRVGQLYQSLVAYAFGHAFVASDRPVAPPESPVRNEGERYSATQAAGPFISNFDEGTYRETLGHIMHGFVGEK